MADFEQGQDWLEIHDEAVTAEALMAEVEERVTQRRVEHGRLAPEFPTFGYVAAMPEPHSPQENPTLYHHLRQLNRMAAPETTAVLIPTPSTRLPIIGWLWKLFRGQMHNLILFYVNRALAHRSRTDHHTLSVVNELVRLIQKQQREIARLQQELDELKAGEKQ